MVGQLMKPTRTWVRAYPTLHMDILVKQLEIGVYGVRITANMGTQAEREEPYRMAE